MAREMGRARQFVFAYGSLAAAAAAAAAAAEAEAGAGAGAGARSPVDRVRRERGFVAELPGFARGWGVAMDNRRDLPGYKYYADADGGRPAVFIAFLDVGPAPGPDRAPAAGRPARPPAVNGLCLPVTDDQLSALDRRERNYRRIDVSDALAAGARVWTYTGSPEGRERFARGRRGATLVIHAAYLRGVEAAFAALGPREWEACRASVDPGEIPVRELTRHELSESRR